MVHPPKYLSVLDDKSIQQAKARLGIIGNDPSLLRAIGRAMRVAPIDVSVLVNGESGAGKEFFPQIIHQYSHRKHAKYIAVNCGAIPEGTIDSELFGHEKGSFTGALGERRGYFEEANGGTLFLDEVAELPLTTQARLLRVLESGEFLRVGSSTVQRTNVRIVAATNVNLAEAVARGTFREDLFYRLSAVNILVPPLRARGNDILLLAQKFAADFADAQRQPVVTLGDDARERLLAYPFPGNVRQLKNIIEQLSIFEAGTILSGEKLAEYLPAPTDPSLSPAADSAFGTSAGHYTGPTLPVSTRPIVEDHTYAREREMLFTLIFNMKRQLEELRDEVARLKGDTSGTAGDDAHPSTRQILDAIPQPLTEKEEIRLALERHMGRRPAAAADLGMSERTLYRKIKEYGLEDL